MIIHQKKDYKFYQKMFVLGLIPLILFGIYKNGFLLYQKNLISLGEIFKPLYIILISLVINLITQLIFKKKINFYEQSYLDVIIFSLFAPPNANLVIYSIILMISLLLINFLAKKITFNKIAILKIIYFVILMLINNYSYMNLLEKQNLYAYNLFDFLWGFNKGGIASTNIIMGILLMIYFQTFTNYKIAIPLISSSLYILFYLIISLISNSFDYQIMLSSTTILGFILVANNNFSTPYQKKEIIKYSILLGIITAFLSFVVPHEAVFIAIFILSIIDGIKNKLKK